jgi:hypothetical protein
MPWRRLWTPGVVAGTSSSWTYPDRSTTRPRWRWARPIGLSWWCRRSVAALHCAALALVVRGPAPGRLRPKAIAQSLGLPLAGTLRPEPGLACGLERGVIPAGNGRGPLAALCRHLVDDLLATRTESAA